MKGAAMNDDDDISLRDFSDSRWAAHAAAHIAEHAFVLDHWKAHSREHEADARSSQKADDGNAHAVAAALASVEKANVQARTALAVALEDHHREHTVHEVAHGREHVATENALAKAEVATEKRFESVNEFREQLRTQAATLASRDQVESLVKEIDRRFAESSKATSEWRETFATSVAARFDVQAKAITVIEKGDVEQEGKGMGQGAVVAALVGTVGFALTFITLVIVIANVVTGGVAK